MKQMIIASVAVLCLAAFAVPAFAQSRAKVTTKASVKKKAKVYDFTGDDIDGELVRPDGDGISVRERVSHTSPIKLRRDFIKEILKSIEDL